MSSFVVPLGTMAEDIVGSIVESENIGNVESLEDRNVSVDVVVCDEKSHKEYAELIDGSGANTLLLRPRSLDTIYREMERVGKAVGNELKARTVIASTQLELRSIKKMADYLGYRPHVYCEGSDGLASGHWVPGLIEAAGGKPFLKEGSASRKATKKDIETFNPDIVLFHTSENKKEDPIEKVESKGWNIDAMASHIADSYIERPGPHIWKGASEIKGAIDEFIMSV
ncbi:MAG: ABC transporter substrate-binding protein [Methanobacteriota archaeon]|nr:MAG: ABC transporter substrate-binding protein [Euryarchaeota archaeon]